MGSAQRVTPGFFPLDDELQLLPGGLTPRLQEQLTRLGAWMPFGKAAGMFEDFTRVTVSEDYAQQHTEDAGAAYVAQQTAEVERLERETPLAPPGPTKLYLSADGAFVPLVGGEWAEVKTLVMGEVGEPIQEKGEWVVHTRNLSYFSRRAEAETFTRLALVETQRRGVENAGQVGAVLDGAEWLQGFVTWHRPDAVRILDFPHAAGYVGKIGQATFGADTPELAGWLKTRLQGLKHQGPDEVLAELQEMVVEHPGAEALELPKALAYLEKRKPQMHYPTFQADGWPIGSGATESGNKLVVEARLKGAGMHWAPRQVDPMLALRNIVCNDRWQEAWPQIVASLRQRAAAGRAERQQKRRQAHVPRVADQTLDADFTRPPAPVAIVPPIVPGNSSAAVDLPRPETGGTRRPAPNHPWRRSPIGRAQYQPAKPREAAKL
jgi:hypothetical protein